MRFRILGVMLLRISNMDYVLRRDTIWKQVGVSWTKVGGSISHLSTNKASHDSIEGKIQSLPGQLPLCTCAIQFHRSSFH